MSKTVETTREMKDSGIEWLGEIPTYWNVVKYKTFAKSGMGETILAKELTPQGIPVYSATQDLKVFGYYQNPKKILLKGDFIIPARGSVGYMHQILDDIATCTQTTIFSKIKNDDIHLRYVYFCGQALGEYWFEYDKTTVPQLTVSQVQNNLVPIPPLHEQQAIANYLDEQVGKMDRLISEQKQAIEQWKAYKQSLITETVTKGLNPNVEMKDSGIEWIGKIPSEWQVCRGKHVLKLIKRSVKEDDGVITCFRDGEVTLRSNRRDDGFTFSLKEIGYQGIEPGDLVIHGMDGFAGAIGVSDSRGKGSPVLNVCDVKVGNKRYYMYYLRMLAINNVFLALATGIRERSCDLRWSKLANLEYTVPPIYEQKQIADYLDKKCSKINEAIEQKQTLIKQLEEYKQSLIYECVTGKRCVL